MIRIRVENFDLDLTFSPSFVSSLYDHVAPSRWVKIAGHLGGQLELRQTSKDTLEVRSSSGLTEEALKRRITLEVGLWRGPYEELVRNLPQSVKPAIEGLADNYPGVRLPIAPLDLKYLLLVAVLSRRAGYDRYVRSWSRKIWSEYNGDLRLIASARGKEIRKIGKSYQILQLPKIVKSFCELEANVPTAILDLVGPIGVPSEEFLFWLTPELARLALIKGCWGIGPKTADSVILSTFKATHFIPCDVHLMTVAERLGLVEEGGTEMPRKSFCSRYVCEENISKLWKIERCPLAKRNLCLRSKLAYLKKTGGWVQTLAYLHGIRYCSPRSPRCGECRIRDLCSWRR